MLRETTRCFPRGSMIEEVISTLSLAAIAAAVVITTVGVLLGHKNTNRRISSLEGRIAALKSDIGTLKQWNDSTQQSFWSLHRELQGLKNAYERHLSDRHRGIADTTASAADARSGALQGVMSGASAVLDGETPLAPQEPDDREYSVEFARDLFAQWSRDSRAPTFPATVEVARLEYNRREPSAEIGAPSRHVLLETARIGEFVRISQPKAEEGLLFPNPDAYYVAVMRDLFPALGRKEHGDPTALGAIEPVRVRRRTDSEWEVV